MKKTLDKGVIIFLTLAILTVIFVRFGNWSFLQKNYSPNFGAKHNKAMNDDGWITFENAVNECRSIIKGDTFLEARSAFWEDHGIEPAVGYTAWLFQESRFNGEAEGDKGKAHGYGQIHPKALEEVNKLREERGVETFKHNDLLENSPKNLQFFLEAIHDYNKICLKRYKWKRNTLDYKLNCWNQGGKRGRECEHKSSGQIKSLILQYYQRLRDEKR